MVVNYLFSFTLSSPLPSWLAFPFSPSFFPHLDAAWLVTFFYGRALRLTHHVLHLYRKLLRDINAELKKKIPLPPSCGDFPTVLFTRVPLDGQPPSDLGLTTPHQFPFPKGVVLRGVYSSGADAGNFQPNQHVSGGSDPSNPRPLQV